MHVSEKLIVDIHLVGQNKEVHFIVEILNMIWKFAPKHYLNNEY